ncbi:hypothetical protein ACIQUL_29930 [Streptomyces sp. NPDC090303]|uniref:hypothetical protein n=1 Tax=Streptomyces sp. NPDC090303 TaxID=3365960 RepID=UPI0037F5481C
MTDGPNERLQTLFQAAGWDCARGSRVLRAVAVEQGLRVSYDRKTVQRWLRGAKPRPPAPALLLEGLSRALGRLVTAHEAGLTHAPSTLVDLSWDAAPSHRIARLAYAEVSHASTASDAQGFSVAALLLPDWLRAEPPARSASRALPWTEDVSEIYDMISMFDTAAGVHGGGHLRIPAAGYLMDHVVPLFRPPAIEPGDPELRAAAARFILLLADLCVDSGLDRSAQQYQQVAVRIGFGAGDAATVAAGLSSMVAHAQELGHHEPAVVALAERAVVLAGQAPPAVRSCALAQLAFLEAQGDRRAALATLTRAERLHREAVATPDPVATYSLAALQCQRASTFVALGDTAGAVRALAASLRARGPDERCATAIAHARIAELCASLGRFEQSVEHSRAFLSVYPTLHSARAARRLDSLCRQLHARETEPVVRAFLSQERPCGRPAPRGAVNRAI